METIKQEIRIAKEAAKRGAKAAGRAAIMKWYRNTKRKTYKRFRLSYTCSLCRFHDGLCNYCIAHADDDGCCGGRCSRSYVDTTRAAWDVVDYLALAWVNEYQQSIRVGEYIYYLG